MHPLAQLVNQPDNVARRVVSHRHLALLIRITCGDGAGRRRAPSALAGAARRAARHPTGDIDDVKYLRDKLFSALKVPMSYLSRGEGGEEDKTTLAQKDIRFARTIQRLQRSVISELEKIGIIHLFTLGFRGDDLIGFQLSLQNPSKIAEMQELEHWKAKFDTAGSATEGFFSKRWLAKKMFGLTEEEFLRNQREMFSDRKFEASLEVVGEQEQAALGTDPGGTGVVGMEPELAAGGDLAGTGMEDAAAALGVGDTPTDAAAAGGDLDQEHGGYDSEVQA